MVPINLSGETNRIEVYIIPALVPFLIRGQTLRTMKAKIDLDSNSLVIKGKKVQLDLTRSGHMALPWEIGCHKSIRENKVLLTQKVSRKEFNEPEVMAAMIKEINNLVENGTYEEVK